MRVYYNTIRDFINIRSKCPFCSSGLIPILTNYVVLTNKLPLISSKLSGDVFIFNFNYNAYCIDILAKGCVNIDLNTLIFNIDENNSSENASSHIYQAFMNHYPHIELTCMNKKCKTNYYIASDILCINYADNIFSPLSFGNEFCSIGKYTIINYHHKKYTEVFIKDNQIPIETQYLDFELLGKDKLLSKIKTVIAFS